MNNYKTSILVLSALVVGACETVIDVDLPVEPTRLVVNSFISPDSTVGVRISKSKYVLDRAQSFILVNNAQVTLLEDGQEVSQLTTEGEGWYTSSFRPQAGRRYTLQASAEGLETVEASSTIMPAIAIQNVTVDSILTESGYSCINDDCEPIYSKDYRIQLQLSDPGDQENFYEILGHVIVKDSFPIFDDLGNIERYETFIRRYRTSFATSDPVVNDAGFSIDDDSFYGSSLLFTDEIFSGKDYTIDFTTDDYFGGEITNLTITLRTLSEDQYQYLRTRLLQEYNEGDPFSEVVPVYNNIQNGFGIFAGYSADSVVVKVE